MEKREGIFAMGIWGSIKQSAKEANEGAHASRLKNDLELTLRHFESLDADRKAECAEIFLLLVTDLMTKQGNWSRDGAIKLSKEMFKDARERHDFDRSRSYAIALSGLWFESQYRDHEDAKKVYHDLSTLYERLMYVALNENPDTPAKRLESHQPVAKKISAANNKKPAAKKNSADNSKKPVVRSDEDREKENVDIGRLHKARNACAVGDLRRAKLLIENISHPSLSTAKAVLADEINTKAALTSKSTTKSEPPTTNKRRAYEEPRINKLDPLSALMLEKAVAAISRNNFELAEKILSRDFPLYFEESKRKVVFLLASKKARIQNTRK
jgi:hypothetical protein